MDFNWGLIGPGRIAEKFAEAMKAEGVGRLKAVASRNADRAHAFGDRHQVETVYTDYTKLYQDDSLDGIYIATPHNFHLEQALGAIACGKHLEYQIRHVVRCIAEGKAESEVMPHERTLSSQRIMDQVRRDAGLLLGDHKPAPHSN